VQFSSRNEVGRLVDVLKVHGVGCLESAGFS